MNQSCPRCGAASPASTDLTCTQCGTPRASASALAPAGVPAGGRVDFVSADHGHTGPSLPERRRRRRSLALGAGGLALAVAATGLVSWSVLGAGGGASSPEAAAEQFLTAVAAQDVVGALDMVLPGEVQGAADVFEAERKKAVEKKEMAEEGITEALDITVSDWEFDVEQVDEAVALVTLEDTDLKVRWDLGKIEAKEIAESVDAVEPEDRTGSWPNARDGGYAEVKEAMAEDGLTPTVVTIEEDGRWYVSFLGTVQNSLFQAMHKDGDETFDPARLDWRTVGRGRTPVVGKDSRAVVEQVLTAVRTGDVGTGLAMLPQDQVRALWASWGVLEQTVAEELEKDGDLLKFELELLKWDASEKEVGDDLVEVRVKGAEFRAAFDDRDYDPKDEYAYDETFDVTFGFADGCLNVVEKKLPGEPFTKCLKDAAVKGDAFPDDQLVLMMRTVDGGLQFDPLATLVHYQSTLDLAELYRSATTPRTVTSRAVPAS